MSDFFSGKSAVASLSIWGAGVAGLASLLDILADPAVLAIIPMPYVSLIGAGIAIFGRLTAKKKVTKLF